MSIAQYKDLKQPKKPKYSNEKTVVNGIEFASIKEGSRYKDLLLLLKAHKIRELNLQPVYELRVSGKLICRYKADFSYIDEQEQKLVVEDTKGFRTPVFRIKAKLFEACYGFPITET